jgi:RNA polymerase sigma factor (sigma-70 family)
MSKRADHDQFLALLDEHKKILFKIANSYCRRPADREDLVQEMVLQLWRSFGRYDSRMRFTTWMYRVALNVAISFFRHESRRPRAIGHDERVLLEVASPSDDQSPGLAAEMQLIEALLAQLNEVERALILLYLDGNPYETIGEILGISTTNVGTRIARIKQKLRQSEADHPAGEVTHGTR